MDKPSTAQRAPYVYESLPSKTWIRILRRKPPTEDGLLQFSFEILDLAFDYRDPSYLRGLEPSLNFPIYHCLSYTWGNPLPDGDLFHDAFLAAEEAYSESHTFPIVCDGKILQIRRNLYECLMTIPATDYAGSSMGSKNDEDETLLHILTRKGIPRAVFNMISLGYDVDARNSQGMTPLHLAAENGFYDCTRLLLKGGASTEVGDNGQRSPRDLADINGHSRVTALFDEYQTNGPSPLLDDIAEFAFSTSDDHIWIDAVCINQQDHAERTAQVAMMHRVYSAATYVVVWLGKEDQYIDDAMLALSKMTRSVANFTNSRIVPFQDTPEEDYDAAAVPRISQDEWDALASLFLRQWFSRLWIVQEAVLGGDILMYCGNKQIQWGEIEIAIGAILLRHHDGGTISFHHRYTKSHLTNSVRGYLQASTLRLLKGHRNRLSSLPYGDHSLELKERLSYFQFPNLLDMTSAFQATNPRDHCYALLPLRSVDPRYHATFVADYTLPVETVYINFTREIIRDSEDPLFVLFLLRDTRTENSLPSWVPDFRSKICASPVYNLGFRASFDLPALPHMPPDEKTLHLRGVFVDTISWMTDKEKSPFQLFQIWFTMISALTPYDNYQGTSQSLGEALWRTLCSDSDFNRVGTGIGVAAQAQKPDLRPSSEFGSQFKTWIMLMVYLTLNATRQNHVNVTEQMAALARALGFVQVSTFGESGAINHLHEHDLITYFNTINHILPVLEELHTNGGSDFIPCRTELESVVTALDKDKSLYEAKLKDVTPYTTAHLRAVAGNRLFRTVSGFIGLAPESARMGDAVWIIAGGKTPLVLRDLDPWGIQRRLAHQGGLDTATTRRLSLVGPAYVHGIMHGEGLAKRGIRRWEDFERIALV